MATIYLQVKTRNEANYEKNTCLLYVDVLYFSLITQIFSIYFFSNAFYRQQSKTKIWGHSIFKEYLF